MNGGLVWADKIWTKMRMWKRRESASNSDAGTLSIVSVFYQPPKNEATKNEATKNKATKNEATTMRQPRLDLNN